MSMVKIAGSNYALLVSWNVESGIMIVGLFITAPKKQSTVVRSGSLQ
jgi:hypothetical protein